MIKIKKLPKPNILVANETKWTEEYLDAINSKIPLTDNIKNRYNQEEIKQQLIKETYGKCAYCESKIQHISFADLEHILPKSKRPDLYVNWYNLTLACEVCNRTNKKDYYNPSDPLINPVLENPDDYLLALGAVLYKRPGSRKGEITLSILNLNRTPLIERRVEKLHSFELLVDKYVSEENPNYKKILEEELLRESSAESEYSFILSSYLKAVGININ